MKSDTTVKDCNADGTNMFGLLPCPKCENDCRWPNQEGIIVCDECGHKEAISEDRDSI